MACRNIKVSGYSRKYCGKKAKAAPKGKAVRVSREAALRKSGPSAGKLKPGCRFTKKTGAICRPVA